MRIGAGLLLIAVGAILRFGIAMVSTYGVAIHTIGDILILVGVLGVVLWLVVWAPWTRSRRPASRQDAPADEVPSAPRYPADGPYEDEYRR
jgi:4-amino-4-deoxy-L-arabinose transferase-like glycosyltransferase